MWVTGPVPASTCTHMHTHSWSPQTQGLETKSQEARVLVPGLSLQRTLLLTLYPDYPERAQLCTHTPSLTAPSSQMGFPYVLPGRDPDTPLLRQLPPTAFPSPKRHTWKECPQICTLLSCCSSDLVCFDPPYSLSPAAAPSPCPCVCVHAEWMHVAGVGQTPGLPPASLTPSSSVPKTKPAPPAHLQETLGSIPYSGALEWTQAKAPVSCNVLSA